MDKISILVVDDHPLFRQGVVDIFSLEPDFDVSGEAENGEQALEIIRKVKPSVAVVDINLPGINGQQVLRQVNAEKIPTKIILLTAYDDSEQMLHAMRGGAAAYCSKDVQPEKLVWVIRLVHKGKFVLGDYHVIEPKGLELWLSEKTEMALRSYGDPGEPYYPLSDREMEVLYCFYLVKQALFGTGEQYRMSDKVLSAFIENYITSQPTPVVEFVWQGGEPALLGIDFFKRVIELQKPFAGEKTVTNSLQTNGTLLTAEWCRFLKKNNFMVGISLDGPKEIHDRYRSHRKGNGSYDQVMRGLRLLQEYRVEYNVLACVARETAKNPLDVYRFLRAEGVEFIQFTPVVERLSNVHSAPIGLRLAGPASLDKKDRQGDVTPWSVIPEEYGDFSIASSTKSGYVTMWAQSL